MATRMESKTKKKPGGGGDVEVKKPGGGGISLPSAGGGGVGGGRVIEHKKKEDVDKGKPTGNIADAFLTLEELMESDAYKLMNPEWQEAMKLIFQSYEAGEIDITKLTDREIENLMRQARKIVNPYYREKEGDLDEAYEETLGNNINTMETELSRAQKDLTKALEENNGALAENLKVYTKQLQDTVTDLSTDRDEYVTRKWDYLKRAKEQAKTTLSTELGRISEDETRTLRKIERDADMSMKNFRKTMTAQGYTFSSERFEGEEYLEDEKGDIISMTSTEAKRRRQDITRGIERQLGTGAVSDIAGEYALGGQTGEMNIITAQEVQDIMNQYNRDIRGQLAIGEELYGTSAIQGMGLNVGDYLAGGIEGTQQRATRTAQKELYTGYKRGAEDRYRLFEEQYGTEAAQKAFGSNYGSLAGYYAQQPRTGLLGGTAFGGPGRRGGNTGVVGPISTNPITGSETRTYEQSKQDLEYERQGQLRQMTDYLKGLYKEGIDTSKIT